MTAGPSAPDAEARLDAVLAALDELGHAAVELRGTQIVAATPRFCELVAYGIDELLALPDITPLLVPDGRLSGLDGLDHADRGDVVGPTGMQLRRRDGTTVDVVVAARHLSGTGQLVAVVDDASDEAHRRDQLAAYSEVLERMPVGMLLWRVGDPDDPSSVRIVAANRAAAAGSALRPVDLLGRTVEETFPAPSGVASADLILEAHRTRQVRDLGEERLSEGDGPFGPGTYRRAIVPLPGDVVASLVENVSARRDADRHRRDLLQRIVDAGDEERRRVAADLHDDVIQTLAAVLLETESTRRTEGPAAMDAACARIEQSVRAVMARLRLLVFDLAPPELEEGLAAGVEVAAEKSFEGTGTAVVTSFALTEEPDAETRAMAYRMVAEALANARRHARASTVWIDLRSDDRWLWGTVGDDGQGAERLITPPGHLGLRTMRERAEMLGGTCTVRSVPGEGTTVGFRVPLRATGENE